MRTHPGLSADPSAKPRRKKTSWKLAATWSLGKLIGQLKTWSARRKKRHERECVGQVMRELMGSDAGAPAPEVNSVAAPSASGVASSSSAGAVDTVLAPTASKPAQQTPTRRRRFDSASEDSSDSENTVSPVPRAKVTPRSKAGPKAKATPKRAQRPPGGSGTRGRNASTSTSAVADKGSPSQSTAAGKRGRPTKSIEFIVAELVEDLKTAREESIFFNERSNVLLKSIARYIVTASQQALSCKGEELTENTS